MLYPAATHIEKEGMHTGILEGNGRRVALVSVEIDWGGKTRYEETPPWRLAKFPQDWNKKAWGADNDKRPKDSATENCTIIGYHEDDDTWIDDDMDTWSYCWVRNEEKA